MLCFLFEKTEEPASRTLSRSQMKFLLNFKRQLSFSGNVNLYNVLDLLLKSISVLLCALFRPLVAFFGYFKPLAGKRLLFEEESVDFDEIETPFSTLSFRFPSYDEFLKTVENVDSARLDTSNEDEFLDEYCSIPSTPNQEKSPPSDLNCSNDIGIEDLSIEDEFDDGGFEQKIEDSDETDTDTEEEVEIQIMKGKAKRKSGLPSIPEETEYPITEEEDVKPWKKEESFNHRDTTKELHKFHELYTEKMRKYDTLNHQKTYARELKMMQSKDSAESGISKGLCGCRPDKKTGGNREIEGELELVYVGQMWVSWEFIVWQYKKAMEINGGKEGYGGNCSYNEVAEKFVHFQVVIQRFMENEYFDEGSRVERFARNRLARRKLLQVPLLKEDKVKDNKKKEGILDEDDDNENAVKIDRLIRIMQDSIRILWQFIRADKLAHISTLKCYIDQECTTPTHSKILNQVLLHLQKKERKLKKIIKRKEWRLENCKETSKDEPNDNEVYFLAMVDLRLVSRVLNMKKITKDQLSWCHHKLSCISFPNGKIKIEPSSSFLIPFL